MPDPTSETLPERTAAPDLDAGVETLPGVSERRAEPLRKAGA